MGRVLLADLPEVELDAYFARVKMKRWTRKIVINKSVLRDILRRTGQDRYAL